MNTLDERSQIGSGLLFVVLVLVFLGICYLFLDSWQTDGNPLNKPLAEVNLTTVVTVFAERTVLFFMAIGVACWARAVHRRLVDKS